MSKSEVKRLVHQLSLADAEKKLAKIKSDIDTLESRKHLMIDVMLELRAKDRGLVIGQTFVGDDGGRGKKGVFNGYYRKYYEQGWIKVLLLKADGTVGKREVTFYDNWSIQK